MNHFDRDIAEKIRVTSHQQQTAARQLTPERVMANHFETFLIKHDGAFLILAIPKNLFNFLRNKEKFLDAFRAYNKILDIFKIANINKNDFKIFSTKVLKYERMKLRALKDSLKSNEYIPRKHDGYSKLLLTQFGKEISGNATSCYNLCIPLKTISPDLELQSDVDILEIKHFIAELRTRSDHRDSLDSLHKKAIKLEDFISSICSLEDKLHDGLGVNPQILTPYREIVTMKNDLIKLMIENYFGLCFYHDCLKSAFG